MKVFFVVVKMRCMLIKKYMHVVFTKTTQELYCSTLSNDINCKKKHKKRTPCILL